MNHDVAPLASVVICSYNRARWLAQCLASLQPQLAETADVEVVVVDNNSTDTTEQVVRNLSMGLPRLRYVHEPIQGLAHARNRGLSEARAEWVAMLDDDARVLDGYLTRLRRHAIKGSFDCVGGLYEAWFPEGRVKWFRDSYGNNAALQGYDGELPPDKFVCGGVMLLRRSTVLAVGGFHTGIGMIGAFLGYGEETHLQVMLRRQGGRIGFDPLWRIEHRVTLEKQTLGWQLRAAWATGRDTWTALERPAGPLILLRLVWRLFARPVRGIGRELCLSESPYSWQAWVLAVVKPMVMTLAELGYGIRLYTARVLNR